MEYILLLYKSKINEIKLSEESLFALCQFSKNPCLSTYQLHNVLINTRYKSEYKNVHKKVQNLHDLGLIEKLPRNLGNIEHGAIYYKLTSIGVFHLIVNSSVPTNMDIIKYFGNDPFFELFIYPYLKRETFYNLKLLPIIIDIQRVFTRIGKIINELVEHMISIDRNNRVFVFIGTWDLLTTYRKGEFQELWKTFIFTLKRLLKLRWLDIDVKVSKIDNNTVKFEKDNNLIYLKLDKSKTNLIVSDKNKELYKFPVEKNNRQLSIGEIVPFTVEGEMRDNIKRFNNKIIPEIFEDLAILLVKYAVPVKYSSSTTEHERIEDIKTLSKDETFVKIIKTVKKKYGEYFENFMKEVKNGN